MKKLLSEMSIFLLGFLKQSQEQQALSFPHSLFFTYAALWCILTVITGDYLEGCEEDNMDFCKNDLWVSLILSARIYFY